MIQEFVYVFEKCPSNVQVLVIHDSWASRGWMADAQDFGF